MIRRTLRGGLVGVLVGVVKLYQVTLSPVLGGQCRFSPTCSQYAIEALREHGPLRGARMAAWRVLRCHPLTRGGYDPVPPKPERGDADRPGV
ncbi:MAG: membrane protein insertion efficiency factor YidD [Planctomycetota bacterium]